MLEPNNHQHMQFKRKKQADPLIEGVNIKEDTVTLVRDGEVIACATLKQWHNARWEDLTPVEDIPNSLEEWCNE